MTGSGLRDEGPLWPLLLTDLTIGLGYVLVTRTDRPGQEWAFEVHRERSARGELSDGGPRPAGTPCSGSPTGIGTRFAT